MLTGSQTTLPAGLPPWFRKQLSVRLPEERISAVLGALDRARRPVKKERRYYRRYSWRGPRAILEFPVQRGSEDKETVLAITRNLSVGGLAFLNSYLIPNRQQVMVMPPTTTGLRWPLKAQIVRCRMVDVMIYEIGLRFLGRRKGDLLMSQD